MAGRGSGGLGDGVVMGGGVSLRRATAEDAAAVWAMRREASAARYQPLRMLGIDEVRRLLAERAGRSLGPDLDGDVQWLMVRDGEPAGWVTLGVASREHGLGTVGYTVAERHRGQGVATAGVRALLPLAFSPTGADLARLEAVAAVANLASRRVLERAGFRPEGIARGLLVIAGARVDHARYGLLREEWAGFRSG